MVPSDSLWVGLKYDFSRHEWLVLLLLLLLLLLLVYVCCCWGVLRPLVYVESPRWRCTMIPRLIIVILPEHFLSVLYYVTQRPCSSKAIPLLLLLLGVVVVVVVIVLEMSLSSPKVNQTNPREGARLGARLSCFPTASCCCCCCCDGSKVAQHNKDDRDDTACRTDTD